MAAFSPLTGQRPVVLCEEHRASGTFNSGKRFPQSKVARKFPGPGTGAPKSHRICYTKMFQDMNDRPKIKNSAGRRVLADTRKHRYFLYLTDEENERFLAMYERSGMKSKAQFIYGIIFG